MRYVAKGMATAKLMCASAISQGSYVREFKRVERGKNIDVGAEGQKKGPLRHVPFTVEKKCNIHSHFQKSRLIIKGLYEGM